MINSLNSANTTVKEKNFCINVISDNDNVLQSSRDLKINFGLDSNYQETDSNSQSSSNISYVENKERCETDWIYIEKNVKILKKDYDYKLKLFPKVKIFNIQEIWSFLEGSPSTCSASSTSSSSRNSFHTPIKNVNLSSESTSTPNICLSPQASIFEKDLVSNIFYTNSNLTKIENKKISEPLKSSEEKLIQVDSFVNSLSTSLPFTFPSSSLVFSSQKKRVAKKSVCRHPLFFCSSSKAVPNTCPSNYSSLTQQLPQLHSSGYFSSVSSNSFSTALLASFSSDSKHNKQIKTFCRISEKDFSSKSRNHIFDHKVFSFSSDLTSKFLNDHSNQHIFNPNNLLKDKNSEIKYEEKNIEKKNKKNMSNNFLSKIHPIKIHPSIDSSLNFLPSVFLQRVNLSSEKICKKIKNEKNEEDKDINKKIISNKNSVKQNEEKAISEVNRDESQKNIKNKINVESSNFLFSREVFIKNPKESSKSKKTHCLLQVAPRNYSKVSLESTNNINTSSRVIKKNNKKNKALLMEQSSKSDLAFGGEMNCREEVKKKLLEVMQIKPLNAKFSIKIPKIKKKEALQSRLPTNAPTTSEKSNQNNEKSNADLQTNKSCKLFSDKNYTNNKNMFDLNLNIGNKNIKYENFKREFPGRGFSEERRKRPRVEELSCYYKPLHLQKKELNFDFYGKIQEEVNVLEKSLDIIMKYNDLFNKTPKTSSNSELISSSSPSVFTSSSYLKSKTSSGSNCQSPSFLSNNLPHQVLKSGVSNIEKKFDINKLKINPCGQKRLDTIKTTSLLTSPLADKSPSNCSVNQKTEKLTNKGKIVDIAIKLVPTQNNSRSPSSNKSVETMVSKYFDLEIEGSKPKDAIKKSTEDNEKRVETSTTSINNVSNYDNDNKLNPDEKSESKNNSNNELPKYLCSKKDIQKYINKNTEKNFEKSFLNPGNDINDLTRVKTSKEPLMEKKFFFDQEPNINSSSDFCPPNIPTNNKKFKNSFKKEKNLKLNEYKGGVSTSHNVTSYFNLNNFKNSSNNFHNDNNNNKNNNNKSFNYYTPLNQTSASLFVHSSKYQKLFNNKMNHNCHSIFQRENPQIRAHLILPGSSSFLNNNNSFRNNNNYRIYNNLNKFDHNNLLVNSFSNFSSKKISNTNPITDNKTHLNKKYLFQTPPSTQPVLRLLPKFISLPLYSSINSKNLETPFSLSSEIKHSPTPTHSQQIKTSTALTKISHINNQSPSQNSTSQNLSKIKEQIMLVIKSALEPYIQSGIINKSEYELILVKSSSKIIAKMKTEKNSKNITISDQEKKKINNFIDEYVKSVTSKRKKKQNENKVFHLVKNMPKK